MNHVADITMLPISELKLAEYNPRKKLRPSDRAYRELKKSIEEMGFAESIVVNKDMTVIGGHQRILVAGALGYKELPCTIVDLDKKKEKALNIALNKISGMWDEEKLADIIGELDDDMFDFSSIGFEEPEIDNLLNRVYSVEIKPERNDWIKPRDDGNVISMPGDIWELGRHRIMCGDATEWEDYQILLGDTKVDLVCIDSPYFVNLHNEMTGTIMNDDLSSEEAAQFLRKTFGNLYCGMKADASIYLFYASTRSGLFFSEYERAGFKVAAVPVWVKDHCPPSWADFNFRYEPIIFGWKRGEKHHWYGDGSETTVLEYPGIRSSVKDGYGHPSSKPLQLIAYLVRLSSRQKGIVLDTFLGSGTTIIACEQQNRTCYGMEIEPRFVDTCCRRYISQRGNADDVFLLRDGKRYSWRDVNNSRLEGLAW